MLLDSLSLLFALAAAIIAVGGKTWDDSPHLRFHQRLRPIGYVALVLAVGSFAVSLTTNVRLHQELDREAQYHDRLNVYAYRELSEACILLKKVFDEVHDYGYGEVSDPPFVSFEDLLNEDHRKQANILPRKQVFYTLRWKLNLPALDQLIARETHDALQQIRTTLTIYGAFLDEDAFLLALELVNDEHLRSQAQLEANVDTAIRIWSTDTFLILSPHTMDSHFASIRKLQALMEHIEKKTQTTLQYGDDDSVVISDRTGSPDDSDVSIEPNLPLSVAELTALLKGLTPDQVEKVLGKPNGTRTTTSGFIRRTYSYYSSEQKIAHSTDPHATIGVAVVFHNERFARIQHWDGGMPSIPSGTGWRR